MREEVQMSLSFHEKRKLQFRLIYLVYGAPGLRDIGQVLECTSTSGIATRVAIRELAENGVFQIRDGRIGPSSRGARVAEELGLSAGQTANVSRVSRRRDGRDPLSYIPEDFPRGEDEWFGS